MANGNLPLMFGALVAGAVVIDYGVKNFKGALSTPQSGQGVSDTTAKTSVTTALPSAVGMLAAAEAASKAAVPYSQSVNATGLLAGFRSDCSGFVSWVLGRGGVNVGDATTVTLPTQSNITSGIGNQVTLWNRPLPGNEGHVIIDILGQWFESGGQIGKGVTSMTAAQAAQELGVSSVDQLGEGTTPNNFSPLHPIGL